MSKKVGCYKVKNGKQTKIPKDKCNIKYIDKLLDKGYVVSKVVEEGNKTKIITYSPLTRDQFRKKQKLDYFIEKEAVPGRTGWEDKIHVMTMKESKRLREEGGFIGNVPGSIPIEELLKKKKKKKKMGK